MDKTQARPIRHLTQEEAQRLVLKEVMIQLSHEDIERLNKLADKMTMTYGGVVSKSLRFYETMQNMML